MLDVIPGLTLKNPAYLSRVKQGEGESLQAWLQRFTKATIEVGHLSDDALLLAASSAVRKDTPFEFSISKKSLLVYADFLGRARNYINAEASTLKKSDSSKASRGNPEGDRRKEMKRPLETPVDSNRQHRDKKRSRDSGPGLGAVRAPRPRYDKYQELTSTIEKIFVSSRSEVDF